MRITKKLFIITTLFCFLNSPGAGEENNFFTAYQHMQKGQYTQAISGFKKVIEASPEHLPAYSNLALCYEAEERYGEALNAWQKYINLNPPTLKQTKKHVFFLKEMNRAKEHIAQNNLKDAAPLLQKVTEDRFSSSPIRQRSLQVLAHHYFTQQRYSRSLSYYRLLTKDYPKVINQDILFEYAQSLFFENRFNQALKIYRTLTPTPETRPYIRYGSAACLLYLGKPEKARLQFDRFIQECPEHPFMDKALLGLGLCLKEMEQNEEAFDCFKRICEEYPKSSLIPEALYYQGTLHQKNKEHNLALAYYQRIVAEFPSSAFIDDAHYQIGLINKCEGKEEEALEKFKLIASNYPGSNKLPYALYHLAEYHFNELACDPTVDALRYTQIIDQARHIIANHPKVETSIKAARLIVESHRNSGDISRFRQAFRRYLKMAASFYNPGKAQQLAKETGDNYFEEESYADAGIVYELLIRKYPHSETAQLVEYNLAKCYEKKGCYKQALTRYKRLAKQGPENLKGTLLSDLAGLYRKQGKSAQALKGYGQALDKYVDLQQYDKAITECRKLLGKINSKETANYIHLLIGRFSYMAHRYAEAEEEIKLYLESTSRKTNTNIVEAKTLLSLTYLAQYRSKEAINLLKETIRNYPDYQNKDRLHFLLAYFYLFDYQYPKALSTYQAFIRHYPKSKYQKFAKQLLKKINRLTDRQKQTSPREQNDLNILLISIDTLRADHLSCYGYGRETSPFIDKLAEEGVLFSSATSSSSWTIPSHMSIFTGFYPSVHGVINYATSLESSRFTLTEYLKEQGYKTAGFVSSTEMEYQRGFGQGMDIYDDYTWSLDQKFDLFSFHNTMVASYSVPTAPAVCKSALNWLNRNHQQKFFLFIHFMDPHYDYVPPAPYDTLFDPDYQRDMDGKRFTSNRRVNKDMPKRDLEHIIALYDGEIRHTDRYVNTLVERLKELNLLDNTLIILFGDHGDEFFEHGGKAHGGTLYDELIQVPLIMRCPKVIPQDRVISNQVGTPDILPTILEMLNIPLKDTIQSRSLLSLIKGTNKEDNRTIISEADSHKNSEFISMRQKGYKFICHKFTQEKQLYDLSADPGEQNNLIKDNPNLAQKWEKRLSDWIKSSAKLIAKSTKGKKLTLTEEQKKRLRALGYLQ